MPEKVRDGRFKNWLANTRDWAVSRSRFWGTPIPIWTSEDGEELVVVSSVEELQRLTGTQEKVRVLKIINIKQELLSTLSSPIIRIV